MMDNIFKNSINNEPIMFWLRSSHLVFDISIGYVGVMHSMGLVIPPVNNCTVSQNLGIAPICIL